MSDTDIQRLRVEIRGAVQGVGFRPYVYRLAHEHGLAGWVLNDSRGVHLEVEGEKKVLETFLERLPAEIPPRAVIHDLESRWLEPGGFSRFTIEQSADLGAKTAVILPDVATCPDCLAEVLDPEDRRHGYPFTNCTNCGPRFTIIRALPYDRPNTTMHTFVMCPDCDREYEEPLDRRFHAQPNACPVCGPRLFLWDSRGEEIARDHKALRQAAAAVRQGGILATKGLGGFHLMVDARHTAAVTLLRQRKARYEKSLALMVTDVEAARELCEVSAAAERLLGSPEAPIVLLRHRPVSPVSPEVAPGNPYLGVMLPYTPFHHLLLAELEMPVVATSGNLSDEPICIDNGEAVERLGGIADLFLVHDRPIARHADDSVMTLVGDQPQPIRRARGLAPLPVVLRRTAPTILAVGGHMKNAVALSVDDKVFISQHIGDMETPQAFAAFEGVIEDFLEMYQAAPVAVAHDLHPDYPSTKWTAGLAEGLEWSAGDPEDDWRVALAAMPRLPVQHHHAHLASCLAENHTPGVALGVTWDGTGYGTDHTVWGGEFLRGNAGRFERVARLRPFRLPGGERAVKEPRRVALSLLWETLGESAWEQQDLAPIRSLDGDEQPLFHRMLESGLGSPLTTSAGRLFDGVAALLDLRQTASFEGQAAMSVEFATDSGEEGSYPLPLTEIEVPPPTELPAAVPEEAQCETVLELDWRPLVLAVLEDSRRGLEAGMIAARFHNSLIGAILAVARAIGEARVALTGGCFQNRLLSEGAARLLRDAGFEVLLHHQVPPNDGGISLGQVAVAAARLGEGDSPTG